MKNSSVLTAALAGFLTITSAIQNEVKESPDGVKYINVPMTPINYIMNGKVHIVHVNRGVIDNRVALASRDDPKMGNCYFLEEYDLPQDYCGDNLYWNDTTQDTSPLRSDCQIIVDFLRNKEPHHNWHCGTVDFRNFIFQNVTQPLVEYNSCCFGIHMEDFSGWGIIGDQDISDLISDSMNKFPGGDKISATGSAMPCTNTVVDVFSATVNTSWAIYNPYYVQGPYPTGTL